MSENSENKEMKTSGLRPPTKIPTMGVSRLPSSSSIKLDGGSSIVTKIDGGSSIKKSADMAYVSKHSGLNKKPTDERKSSSGSDSFMSDARRLSEAGVRRSSGNSVVLTEDTDKFIIGNRIWVGGTKPGQIAYIGETNFGNGDWAGVVLDEPIGKNDGSVSGTRYFQCEPKKGIFARLSNLTSAPLSSVEDSMVQSSFAATKPLGFSTPMPKRQGSTVTATKTAVKSLSQTPIAKSSSDLKIGDRVIISSGQGSKLGILRYRGATQFAPGEWCGIELDDPLGKNNGIVEGIRYFECEDKFGLFTPIAKVSKSPMSASRMSTNCAIHKAKRSPGSMNGSMISGITSTTMSSIPTRPAKVSDMDRLKLQLTQVKNENELLRSQVIKAANQADVAEKRLEETLKAQVDKSSESQVNSTIMVQNQLEYIKKQIDEEKEKVQNLQFTNEEQNVVNIELQNKNTELLIKIKELELELAKERNLVKDVEKEKMKIFEKEEELCRIKEELETLKKLIDNNEDELQKSVSNLSSEVVDKEAILNTLRQTLNENSQTHDRLLKEANENLFTTTQRLTKVIEEKEKKIEQNHEMIDQLNEGIKCLSALKNEEHDDIVDNLKNELSKLKNELKKIIDENQQDTKITHESHIKLENELKQELKKISENKNQEIEQLQQKNADLMSLNSSEKDIIEKLKHKLDITIKDLKILKENNFIYSKEGFKKVLEEQIKLNSLKVDDLNKQFDKSISLKDKQIETCNITLTKIKEQLIKSKSCQKNTFNDKIKEKDDEIKTLSEKLSIITSNFEKQENVIQNMNIELKAALKSVHDQTNIIADLEKKYDELQLLQDLNRNKLEKELTTKLLTVENELTCLKSEKSKLEEEHANYVNETAIITNSLNLKLNQNTTLIENLNTSLKELTLSKQNDDQDNQNKIKQLDNCIIQNKNEYEIILKQKEEEIKELLKIGEEKMEIEKLSLEKKTQFILDEKNKENSVLQKKIVDLEKMKIDFGKQLAMSKLQEQDLKQLNETIEDKVKTIKDNDLKIEQLNSLISLTKKEFETKLQEKEVEIKELSKTGEEKLITVKKQIEEENKAMLDEKYNENSMLLEKINVLENSKTNADQIIKQLTENSKTQDNMITEFKISIEEKTKLSNDNILKIDQLNSMIVQCKEEFNTNLKEKEDKIKELIKLGEEKLTDEKLTLEKHTIIILNEKDKEISNLTKKLNNLENSNSNLEKQLEIIKVQEHDIIELKTAVQEKTKVIDDNNSKLELLNSLIAQTKEDFEMRLKGKENEIKELLKSGEEKLINEKNLIEEQNKAMLNEKDKENSMLLEKINVLENTKTSADQIIEKLTENSKIQDNMIAEFKLSIEEKTKLTNDNILKIDQLNSMIVQCKEEFNSNLKEKEDKINELIKLGEEKLTDEKLTLEKHTMIILDEKDKEISNLMEKLKNLENSNLNLEKQLEIINVQEHDILELKTAVQEKTKVIDDNNSKVELLNSLIAQTKEDFEMRLKEKENEIKELSKTVKEKLITEKNLIEEQNKAMLDEKVKEISNLKEKLNNLENLNLNLEKQSEIINVQEQDIIELKTDVLEKTKVIDDNNSKVELLNRLIAQTKEDFDMRLKEKENYINELVKNAEDKLNLEKISFETRIKSCEDEKNTEIKLLKNQLHEFTENSTEKELMLKLETIINELEKEKLRASNLEALKLELEKTVLEHKTELELLELSKVNLKEDMIKTIEKEQSLNAELTAKTKTNSEQLDAEKLHIQKQIDELQNECSRLRSTLEEKNSEIEDLKIKLSHELKPAVSCNDELSQLKALLDKGHSAQSHLEFRIQELTDENHRLNERIEGDSNLLQKNYNAIQQNYNIEKKYEETYNILKIKENQILVLQTELNSWKLKDAEKSKNNSAQEKTDKTEAHLLAEKNQEIKILNSIILGLHKKLSAVMETDVSEYEIVNNPDSVSKEDYQKLFKTAKNNVKLKECENLSLKHEINKLKTENDRYSEYKAKCESLENDKKTLQKLIVSYDSSVPTNNKCDTKSETEKILEEKDWQINLLNNIIADLHSKVSDNKFKIEALETQILDSGIDQNKKVRLRTTRLYCEICEIFDSHDTEDCPKKPESPKLQKKRRVVDSSNRMIDEPFCVCCDMFGHTANECDNSLTF